MKKKHKSDDKSNKQWPVALKNHYPNSKINVVVCKQFKKKIEF